MYLVQFGNLSMMQSFNLSLYVSGSWVKRSRNAGIRKIEPHVQWHLLVPPEEWAVGDAARWLNTEVHLVLKELFCRHLVGTQVHGPIRALFLYLVFWTYYILCCLSICLPSLCSKQFNGMGIGCVLYRSLGSDSLHHC